MHLEHLKCGCGEEWKNPREKAFCWWQDVGKSGKEKNTSGSNKKKGAKSADQSHVEWRCQPLRMTTKRTSSKWRTWVMLNDDNSSNDRKEEGTNDKRKWRGCQMT